MTFTYYSHNTIVFGEGAEDHLEELFAQYQATSILLIYSGDYVSELGIRDHVLQAAAKVGATVIENSDVVPNPRIDLVRKLVQQAREHHVDLVLAAGGASSYDTAKSVAAGVPYDGDVWDLFTGKAVPDEVLPIGVIAGLPGSGSEMSDCAVVQQGKDKRFLEDRKIIPNFTVVDPKNSALVPRRYQAAAIADLATAYTEPYFSADIAIHSVDYFLEGGLRAVLDVGRRWIDDPDDIAVRQELHWISSTGFNDFYFSFGRTVDWTTHRIEHEIGGEFDVIHGEGITALMPSIIRFVGRRQPQRYAQLETRVFGGDPYAHTESELAGLLADEFERFFKDLGLNTTLSALGIPKSSFETIADHVTDFGKGTVGNYSPLSKSDVIEVLNLAY
ncbi:iron-containing alcohol dehydrogenase [Bifidobacterium breve]|uniref:iron-containing alcohol dehydrogenase n=1 Tax=Bifidobacterium breve TaxID=1685 RepID=UPI00264A38BE|nr:iron-containing alcohol dehydrogenase [Bifidobacterium breve]MDO8168991.1 iron-containing alcohol dehydrogenase [Bifidobacterium breve]